jgi:hypothetical protein
MLDNKYFEKNTKHTMNSVLSVVRIDISKFARKTQIALLVTRSSDNMAYAHTRN